MLYAPKAPLRSAFGHPFVVLALFFLMLLIWTPGSTLAQDDAPRLKEEPDRPHIELSRMGHADVNAKVRALSWHVSDPSGLAMVDVRIVKVAMGTMKPTEVFRSEEAEGRIDVAKLQKAPGLYAILVRARDMEKNENEAGLRLSYTEVRKDCPAVEAWWPTQE